SLRFLFSDKLLGRCLVSCLSLFFFMFLSLSLSFTSIAKSNTQDIEISLITISSGQDYWSAFGHSSLRVKTAEYDKMFGFGYFDFEEEDFFLKFAKGEMQYFLGANDSSYELRDYQQQGRKIVSQRLDLTAQQKQKLVSELFYLAQPENRYYPYDYFLNNCTSRIRDLLDEVTNGEISQQLKPQSTQHSWADLTFPATNQAWMNLGIAYAYGIPAFAKKSQWQLSVFPEEFSGDLKSTKTQSSWNRDFQVLYTPNSEDSQFAQYHFLATHYALILLVVILILGVLIKATATISLNLWLVTQSLLGVGLLVLWFFTQHSIAAWNVNILLFSPLAWLLLIKSYRKPWVLNGFLLMNIAWVLLALIFTNLYLLGFCLVNMLVFKRLISTDTF
ncbi:MAG: DUF4105 domain-containing protein, partial [Proteobacteria bacterium]|nr:DUF4105 domain-containing protein [Pseudomonadota bacterium]